MIAKGPLHIAIFGLIIVVSLVLLFGRWHRDEISPAEFTPKTVHYRFQIRNTTNHPVSDAHLIVHAPVKLTGAQRCVRIETSHPHEWFADSGGNQALKFPLDTFAPYASKIVSVRANLMLAAAPVALEDPDPKRYAAPGPDLHPDDTAVRQLAFRLKSENIHATAENLYRWVADNIAYSGYSRKKKGGRNALATRRGDCTEFADLFVALARCVDIPARRVSGYLAHGTSVLAPAGFHDWAEFYENGVWRIADAQKRNFDAHYGDYIAMRIYEPTPPGGRSRRFHRFYVHGKGLTAKMDS